PPDDEPAPYRHGRRPVVPPTDEIGDYRERLEDDGLLHERSRFAKRLHGCVTYRLERYRDLLVRVWAEDAREPRRRSKHPADVRIRSRLHRQNRHDQEVRSHFRRRTEIRCEFVHGLHWPGYEVDARIGYASSDSTKARPSALFCFER